MPTQAKSNSSNRSKSTKTQSKAPKSTVTATPSRTGQARSIAESAVDLPVGAVLELSGRVAELVEPLTARTEAEKQVDVYRTRLRRTVKRTERRGATARRKAATEARKTRTRVEQRVRKVSEQLSALR
jgi:hypothetical protein